MRPQVSKPIFPERSAYVVALIVYFFTGLLCTNVYAEGWTGEWDLEDAKVGYDIQVKDQAEKASVIFYLTNLNIARLSEVSDEAIVADLVDRGFLVVKLDCEALTKLPVILEKSLQQFHFRSTEFLIEAIENKNLVNLLDVYYLPAGYTISKDLAYWHVLEHGAEGNGEQIVRMFNRYHAAKHNKPKVESLADLKGPRGEDIDYQIRMDVVHPAGIDGPTVPLLVNFSTQSQRMNMSSVQKAPDRMIYPLGFLLTGYAWANVDHNFSPVARDAYYGFINRDYSLDRWNGLASSSAAIRFLRAHAAQFHLNGKIGAMGISKASYAVTRLADKSHATLTEFEQYEGAADHEAKVQPNLEFSSQIDVGYTAAGAGTQRFQYITESTVPLAASAGRFDKFDKWNEFPPFVAQCESMGVNYLAFWMEEMGHTYPTGTDTATGGDRYVMLKHFFDANLKPELPPVVLGVMPADGRSDVRIDGTSPLIDSQVSPPPDMKGLPLHVPITVRFSQRMAVSSVRSRVELIDPSTGESLPGEWSASLGGTRFEFLPAEPLRPKTDYVLKVPREVTDAEDRELSQAVESHFRTQ